MKRSSWIVMTLTVLASFFSPIQAQAAACAPTTTIDGGYRYYLFTSSTTCEWVIPTGVRSIDYLAVGGGGGGASRHGGGGGAGGLLTATNTSVTWGNTLSITVGAGGAGAGTGGGNGSNGNDSVISGTGFTTVTALKGGGGGTATTSGSNTVGSGGGATGSGAIGYGTPGQGKNGGLGNNTSGCPGTTTGWCGGGGGGAGFNGTASSASGAGAGGNGVTVSFINVTVATTLSIGDIRSSSVFFAGGGGGGADLGGTAGTGGQGGGSAGSVGTNTASNASARTGGGGGGSGYNSGNNGIAGDGGSGLVVIRTIYDVTGPTFSSSASQLINENTSISVNAAVINVSESSTLTIVSGADLADFTIVRLSTTSAALRFVSSPNFESPIDSNLNNDYLLTVRATDEYQNSSDQSITITVRDINEAPTITTNSGAATWVGNKSENTALVFDFDGTDVDAGTTLLWSLSGTDALDFQVDPNSGILSFISGPDFEAPIDSDANNTYLVTVVVSDGALTASQALTITVTNLNESITPDAPTLSAAPYKGISVTITVKTYTPGKVRFFVGGKRISNCLNKSTTGAYPNAYATCSWKPASVARLTLTSAFTPTDSTFSASTSPALTFWVTRRTGTR